MTHGVNEGEGCFPPCGHFDMMAGGGNYFSLQIELSVLRRQHLCLHMRNTCLVIICQPQILSHAVSVSHWISLFKASLWQQPSRAVWLEGF